MPDIKDYVVTWEMEISADDPEAAARAALAAIKRRGSWANVFHVIDDNGVKTKVDLLEIDEERGPAKLEAAT